MSPERPTPGHSARTPALNAEDIDLTSIVPTLWGRSNPPSPNYLEMPDLNYQDFRAWQHFELCRIEWLHIAEYPIVIALELAASPLGDQWAVLCPELLDDGFPDCVVILCQSRFSSPQHAAEAMFLLTVQLLFKQGLCAEPDCWEQRSEEDAPASIDNLQALWTSEVARLLASE